MNAELHHHRTDGPTRGAPPGRLPGRALAVLGAVLLCGIAQAQEVELGLRRLVATDAARLLQAADPVVRGEAALIVADTSSISFHTAILDAAADEDPVARCRGIVALGLQATPGTAVALEGLLASARDRSSQDGVAAAFALGLLPPDHAPAVVSGVLTGFLRGNLRRQHEPLLALLLGLSLRDPATQATALQQLFDEEALRDEPVRAQLLALLLRTERPFDAPRLCRVLERGTPGERVVVLRWLADNVDRDDRDLLADIERAARGGDPALRTAALAALTRRGHLPALELAARAMQSNDAAECGQGMRSVLAIGGAGMRGALERHLIDERDPVRKAALLANFDAPPSPRLADHAAVLATDPGQPFPVRTAAAVLLARCAPERASAMLRDLFRSTTGTETLPQLAALLLRDGQAEPTELTRLLHGPSDLSQHPARWQALLAAEHPAAVRQLMTVLHEPEALRDKAIALQAWRRARVLDLPRPVVGQAPAVLREALGG